MGQVGTRINPLFSAFRFLLLSQVGTKWDKMKQFLSDEPPGNDTETDGKHIRRQTAETHSGLTRFFLFDILAVRPRQGSVIFEWFLRVSVILSTTRDRFV